MAADEPPAVDNPQDSRDERKTDKVVARCVTAADGTENQEPHHRGDTGAVVTLGETQITKTHAGRSSFEKEVTNNRRLADAAFRHVPRLLNVDDDALSFTTERVTPWSELDVERRSELLPAVGRALAYLHELDATEHDAMLLSDAVRARMHAAQRRLTDWRSVYREPLLDELGRIDLDNALRDVRRVFCHRDFRPQNWGYSEPRATFVVFDLEHARNDFAATDFARLHTDLSDDEVREVLAGYAEVRDLPSSSLRRLGVLLHVLQTWAWAEQHDDDVYREEARGLGERRSLWSSES